MIPVLMHQKKKKVNKTGSCLISLHNIPEEEGADRKSDFISRLSGSELWWQQSIVETVVEVVQLFALSSFPFQLYRAQDTLKELHDPTLQNLPLETGQISWV